MRVGGSLKQAHDNLTWENHFHLGLVLGSCHPPLPPSEIALIVSGSMAGRGGHQGADLALFIEDSINTLINCIYRWRVQC